MQRRTFLASAAALAGSAAVPAYAQSSETPIDVVAAIKDLRIASGPFAGGYEVAPNGLMNWYFAALGLLPIVSRLSGAERESHIRPYLDLYIRCLTPARTIQDVHFPQGRASHSNYTLAPSDSDDSYAATFLSLAVRYVRVSGNVAWWHANKAVMLEVAYRNLAVMAKPTGLTSVFQPPRNAQNGIGYTMDNCEVYRGLRDFASALADYGNPVEASYYHSFAEACARGLRALWRSTPGGFTPGDAFSSPERGFYPGTTCQVFPEAFDVQELRDLFAPAWNYLERHTPGWETGRYDVYPWAVLGYVAAKRNQTAKARTQVREVQGKFVTQRHLVTINELGWHQRTKNLLAGQAEL